MAHRGCAEGLLLSGCAPRLLPNEPRFRRPEGVYPWVDAEGLEPPTTSL